MSVPKFLQPYLASYELSKLDKDSDDVRKEVISQVLNLGDQKAVRWVFRTYSLGTIKEALRRPLRGIWFYDSLVYWQKILDVTCSPLHKKKAISGLNPKS